MPPGAYLPEDGDVKREELLVTLFVLLLLLLFASSLIYFAEHDAQPDIFSSIPAAMWWAVATLTTVGYGDVYPVTTVGKLVASVIAVLGIGMFALPTGILGAGFVEELQSRKRRPRTCPHCGKSLEG
jgi:voltage-gated potassium channel